jgi:hypothetical protein
MCPSSEAVKRSCESGEKHNDLMGMAWPVSKTISTLYGANKTMDIKHYLSFALH